MITFKKREIIYRPHEPIVKLIVDMIMIVCAAYLLVIAFFDSTQVAGHSMNNTLKDGDTVLIDKVCYEFREPKRYDLIVFEPKVANVSEFYVKRIIALPGETVLIRDGRVYIDGKRLESDLIDTEIYNPGLAAEPIALGANQFFVLGDNRNNSDDSRFSNVGLVNGKDIIGRAWMVTMPLADFGFPYAQPLRGEEQTSSQTEAATGETAPQ
ncbi:MAG: signal peptidase I [Butyrivibrio sp.]|nr:signal peptidase I [Butyrivibrio sp.]